MAIPSRLGRYAVQRRIGSGAFATVWLAYDEQLDSPVAVKVLGDIWTEDHQIRQRFVEEGRYLRKVESPYVVSVYDAGELDDGRPYLVMSYADQGTLADRLEGGGGFTTSQALQVLREIAEGLQALHDRGVVHRDVKPANVLFRSVAQRSDTAAATQVRAMLGDLGLGKALDGSSRLTMIAGTPSFIAPEQAAAESPGPAADQYSLAALSYLLLTGRRPFERASIRDATVPVARDPISTPDRPFPELVEVVVGRGLSFAPSDRYPSVSEFVVALEAALAPRLADDAPYSGLFVDPERTQPAPRPSFATRVADEPGPTVPASPPPSSAGPRRRRRLLVGVVAVLGAIIALVGGAGGGFAARRAAESGPSEVTVRSDSGTLSVLVPSGWDHDRATDGWRPPGADQDYDVISVGTTADWTAVDSRAEGVFVGLLPGDSLPVQLPQHPECGGARPTSHSGSGDGASVTAVYQDCPGGVTVERVVQVTNDELLWVQIRSRSQASAGAVLDTVKTSGL